MCRLIESIKLNDGVFYNLDYHKRRMSQAMLSLFSTNSGINLEEVLSSEVVPPIGLYKCRIVYDNKIHSIEFQPYRMKRIQSLKIVEENSIEYNFKYQDRATIDQLFYTRELCDDVLIVKNGHITDTSYANIVFNSGNEWITPSTPLLVGSMRQYLLDRNIIREEEIMRKDIANFKSFKLINAMVGFDMPEISIDNIIG